MKDGKYWLSKLGDTLVTLAEWIAVNKYEGAPDVDDRVADAMLSVVEAANRFKPRPGQDAVGYFLNYVLRCVAGDVRRGASIAKRWSDEAAVYSDVAPAWLDDDFDIEATLGISLSERQDAPHIAEENKWVSVKSGKEFTTMEVVNMLTGEHSEWTRKRLNTKKDDAELRMALLQVLDKWADTSADPTWLLEPAPPAALCPDYDIVEEVRMVDGKPAGTHYIFKRVEDEKRDAAEAASKNGARWMDEVVPGDDRPDRDGAVKAMKEDRQLDPRIVNFWENVVEPRWVKATMPETPLDKRQAIDFYDVSLAPARSGLSRLAHLVTDEEENRTVAMIVGSLMEMQITVAHPEWMEDSDIPDEDKDRIAMWITVRDAIECHMYPETHGPATPVAELPDCKSEWLKDVFALGQPLIQVTSERRHPPFYGSQWLAWIYHYPNKPVVTWRCASTVTKKRSQQAYPRSIPFTVYYVNKEGKRVGRQVRRYPEKMAFTTGSGGMGYTPKNPDAETLRQRALAWLDKVMDLAETNENVRQAHRMGAPVKVHVWASQAAAIKAIVLTGASPQEAKTAERRAYAGA
ncbi:MAG: hypothetical protein GY832_20150 [Chloroflexi bacterium]|nr:hypothetical protein [Chloroflexota bacterium]